jgi:UDP-N-acetylglucosamine/UDP-N-acetylgalactosamine diphosphorylase
MDLQALLETHRQTHLLPVSRLLPTTQSQLAAIDWTDVSRAHREAGPLQLASVGDAIFPVEAVLPDAADRDNFRQMGIWLLSQGKVAFVLMAGGQGSRLGHSGPKGSAPLGFPNGTTLFHLLVRRMASLLQECGKLPPFLVMTSPENDAPTRAWFAEHASSLPEGAVRFFQQGVMPALDVQGRVLLSPEGTLALAPDGNGGIFRALTQSGELERLARSGVEWLHIAGVDNALSLPCDPAFVGFAQASGLRVASKTVERTEPGEKAGVFRRDAQGNGGVAEYTEIGELAAARSPDGGLVYREANIASHLVRLELVQRFGTQGLPWHLARKKLPYLDPETGLPGQELVCKYERFLFDAFPLAGPMALLRVSRSREFAPIKNAEGPDSPATALAALLENGENFSV